MAANLRPARGAWPRGPVLPLFTAFVLVLLVLVVHGGLMTWVVNALAELHTSPPMPERMQVRYVREMVLAAPAPPAPPPATRSVLSPPAPRPSTVARKTLSPTELVAAAAPEAVEAAPPAESPASSALFAEPASSVSVERPSEAPAAPPEMAAEAVPGELASRPTSAAADSLWPQTTRVRYGAQGYYRGDIFGDATVEWVRHGNRYQMHMDVNLGWGAFSRKATSQGRIAEQGVLPERYDESTKMPFRSTRRLVVVLGEDWVELAQGQRTARPLGLQDTASQFVQLTYLFTTQPELAQAGQRIEFPLAFPRAVRAYAYQVQGRELLQTPMGPLDTLHVIPRRVDTKDKDLVAQAWFAPALNYLPARIRITQGEEIYIDLLIAAPPELTAN